MRYLNFLIKPASSVCNLRCKYCFYQDEAEKRSQESMGLMTQKTVDVLLDSAFGMIDPGGSISFAFQGGEPTVAGLEFFRQFTAKVHSRRPKHVNVNFSIQTNGTLIDADWAEFFSEERFLVGISIDGFKKLHDFHRVDAAGNGSWKRVMDGLTVLKAKNVEVNALCVVTRCCARSPEKIYRNLKKLGFRYIQFIACLDPIGDQRGNMPYSLTPEAYGKFLCTAFDAWYADWEQGQYHSVRLFDDYIHILLGDGASTCATCGNCGSYFVVEGDGSVYPCDFFVLDEWKMGALGKSSLDELAQSDAAQRFLLWGREKPAECARCRWGRICNGGCKNDWEQTPDGIHNYYCKSFQMLLDYAGPRLARIAHAELAARRFQRQL